MRHSFQKAVNLYSRYQRHLASIFLVGGFVFTTLTLTRVDEFIENFWIVIHIAVAAFGIFMINVYEHRAATVLKSPEQSPALRDKKKLLWNEKIRTVLLYVTQFAFGGCFSTFLVFYFRSSSLSVSWPFLLILSAIFIANERLRRHYSRLTFQIIVLFISIYLFAIFFIPVVLKKIGPDIFVLSGFISLLIICVFLMLLRFVGHEKFKKSGGLIWMGIGAVLLLMNVLYFTNIMPPIPLSLKQAGVYHNINRQADGNLSLLAEQRSWPTIIRDFFRFSETYHQVPGEDVYVFSAVFSPTDLSTDIVHEWQYFDEGAGHWITSSRIDLGILGGRASGYRTYSVKSSVFPGKWRVNVETQNGQLIGRVKFVVEASDINPPVEAEVK